MGAYNIKMFNLSIPSNYLGRIRSPSPQWRLREEGGGAYLSQRQSPSRVVEVEEGVSGLTWAKDKALLGCTRLRRGLVGLPEPKTKPFSAGGGEGELTWAKDKALLGGRCGAALLQVVGRILRLNQNVEINIIVSVTFPMNPHVRLLACWLVELCNEPKYYWTIYIYKWFLLGN